MRAVCATTYAALRGLPSDTISEHGSKNNGSTAESAAEQHNKQIKEHDEQQGKLTPGRVMMSFDQDR
jgi:hypothetical protein